MGLFIQFRNSNYLKYILFIYNNYYIGGNKMSTEFKIKLTELRDKLRKHKVNVTYIKMKNYTSYLSK